MKSIRFFLTITIISAIILANFLAALHGYQESMQEAELLFDQKLDNISGILAVSSPTSFIDESRIIEHSENSIAFQVRTGENRLLFQSSILDKGFHFELQQGESYQNYKNFRWRKITRFYPDENRWVLLMEKQDVRYKLAESVILKSVYPIVLAVPTIALIIFFIVRRGLLPITLLEKSVETKQAGELSTITLDEVPEELSQLTTKINDLLIRLDISLNREKQFSADAAHELRTPIAALNIQMKNLLDECAENPESLLELELGVKRMSHLVEQILLLNRSTPDFYAENFTTINLSELLKELISELYPLIEQRDHEIEFYDGHRDGVVDNNGDPLDDMVLNCILGDEFALMTLFKNLIVNAIKYTPIQGNLRVELQNFKDRVVVSVMDSGEGIEESERLRIFDRFYRLDGDRNSSNVVGCGLGLAIVKQIAELHSAKLSVNESYFTIHNENEDILVDHGLCVSVSFSAVKISHNKE
jgi:two-component system, OmpR family, sensor kinase